MRRLLDRYKFVALIDLNFGLLNSVSVCTSIMPLYWRLRFQFDRIDGLLLRLGPITLDIFW